MTSGSVQTAPRLSKLPETFPRDGAINIEIEEGTPVLRATKAIQERIEELLDKQRDSRLTEAEENELRQYEEIDDYLSFLNRLVRNLAQIPTPEPLHAS
ncbi:MAG: hypothetical protein MOB07_11815 [Acidobacteria bacterium]|nr:hypothetical protein [Acidobacteriota bacterium]